MSSSLLFSISIFRLGKRAAASLGEGADLRGGGG